MNEHSEMQRARPAAPNEEIAVQAPSRRCSATPAMIVLLALWVGLVAGFFDMGLLIFNRRVLDRDFIRLGSNYPWIIPTCVAALMVVPGILLAVIARMRNRAISVAVPLWVFFFLGLLDMCARLPLEPWAALLICGGLATQSVRMLRTRGAAFLRIVRLTAPALLGLLAITMAATIGGQAWSEHRLASSVRPTAPPGARNVVLIVWDTVRASNLSVQGYVRPTTPNLQRLAESGVRFERAFSTSSWTLPSHASLFTGRWPHELGVDWKSPLRDDVPTLAEYLVAHGYDTAGFVANLDYCARETGLGRGMMHYEDFPIDVYDAFGRYVALGHRLEIFSWAFIFDSLLEKCFGRWFNVVPRSREHVKRGSDVSGGFLNWLGRRQDQRRPFFAFLNFNDAHSPYEVPDATVPGFGLRPATSLDRQTLVLWNGLDKARLSYHDVRLAADLYDDCIAYLDRQLGMLVDELGRRGVLDETLVIVTSDHGEHLGDHLLFFHGCSLYRQLVQVPLVIVDKKGVPTRRVFAEPVSLCDLPATVVDLLGLGRDAPFPGRSLSRFWRRSEGAASFPEEPLLMETGKPELLANQGREPAAKGPMKSVIARGMHYIRTADGLEELYMLDSDPEETINLAGTPNAAPIRERFRNTLEIMKQRGRSSRSKP